MAHLKRLTAHLQWRVRKRGQYTKKDTKQGRGRKRVNERYEEREKEKKRRKETNKAGYTASSCGRVGRGGIAYFSTFRLDQYGPMDGPTDRRTKPLMELRVRNKKQRKKERMRGGVELRVRDLKKNEKRKKESKNG